MYKAEMWIIIIICTQASCSGTKNSAPWQMAPNQTYFTFFYTSFWNHVSCSILRGEAYKIIWILKWKISAYTKLNKIEKILGPHTCTFIQYIYWDSYLRLIWVLRLPLSLICKPFCVFVLSKCGKKCKQNTVWVTLYINDHWFEYGLTWFDSF